MATPAVSKDYTVPDATDGAPTQPLREPPAHAESRPVLFRVWRGDKETGKFVDYKTQITTGMVVLDAIHQIQAETAPDLACRWNCKAGKCGSCSAEVNGKPRLMCMTRMSELSLDMPIIVEPMKAFPPIRDLVIDVSWNL